MAKKNPSGQSITPLENYTCNFPFSFVPFSCGFISFPGKEIMPHPFLCPSDFLPGAIPMVGDHGKAGKGLRFIAAGEWRGWGLSKEEMFSLLGMRMVPGEGGVLSPWGANCCCFNLYNQAQLGRIIYWPTGHLHFWDRILKELLNTASNKAHNDIFLYAEPWELNWGGHSLFSKYWFHMGS